MTHSKMLATRRRKQRGKKQLARIAKGAKKLNRKKAGPAGAEAAKKSTA